MPVLADETMQLVDSLFNARGCRLSPGGTEGQRTLNVAATVREPAVHPNITPEIESLYQTVQIVVSSRQSIADRNFELQGEKPGSIAC